MSVVKSPNWSQTTYILRDDFKLLVLLPIAPECWGYRQLLPSKIPEVLGQGTRKEQDLTYSLSGLQLSYYVVKNDPRPLKCWYYRLVPPYLTPSGILSTKSF